MLGSTSVEAPDVTWHPEKYILSKTYSLNYMFNETRFSNNVHAMVVTVFGTFEVKYGVLKIKVKMLWLPKQRD